MLRVHILGGTGYAGGHIAHEAAKRDHKVVSFSRKLPAKGISKITYKTGDVLDDAFLTSVFDDADVVISALSPRGSLEGPGSLRAVLHQAASVAGDRGIRFGVIGGAGSLFTEPGGPRFVDTPEFPAFAKPEAFEMAAVLEDLKMTPQSLDWFFVSPAGQFGRMRLARPQVGIALGKTYYSTMRTVPLRSPVLTSPLQSWPSSKSLSTIAGDLLSLTEGDRVDLPPGNGENERKRD